MSETVKLNLFALFALIGLTLFIVGVFNVKATVTTIQLWIHEKEEIFLTDGETRILTAIIGMLFVAIPGFIFLDIPRIMYLLLGHIAGAVLVWAGIVKNNIILTLMYILPTRRLWDFKYDGITRRVIVVIFGVILLCFSISELFKILIN
ncbi:MAG: hypothetical protein E7417_05820 [Ruminococcaceae bacterium]|nr:hypothetical protein [Oscillospiraceae bacterium]